MFHVYNQISRTSKELIKSFKSLGVATVYEAAGRIGSVNPHIKPLVRGIKLLGPAFTVQCHPKDNLMLHKALQIAQEGDILIVSTQAYPEAGYWGSLMSTSASTKKIGGMAIDGCIRDSKEVIQINFPIFCRGTCIRGTTKSSLGLINHPIIFGDVIVNPGDLVLGDNDGMVIIPQSEVKKVLESAQERVEKEKEKTLALSQGVSSVELNNLEKVFQSIGLKED